MWLMAPKTSVLPQEEEGPWRDCRASPGSQGRVRPSKVCREGAAKSSNTWGTSLSSSWNAGEISVMTHRRAPISGLYKTVASRSSP